MVPPLGASTSATRPRLALSKSLLFLSLVAHARVLPFTSEVVVSFANQVKQAARMDRVARDYARRSAAAVKSVTSGPVNSLTSAGNPRGFSLSQPGRSPLGNPPLVNPLASSLGNTQGKIHVDGLHPEFPLAIPVEEEQVKSAEDLVKMLYAAQQLGTELEESVRDLHDAYRHVVQAEAEGGLPLSQDSPEMFTLTRLVEQQEQRLELHELLKAYVSQLAYYETLILEANFMDKLVGRTDRNFVQGDGYLSFFDKVTLKRRLMTALRGHQTQRDFVTETKATLVDTLDSFASGSWDTVKMLTSPRVLLTRKSCLSLFSSNENCCFVVACCCLVALCGAAKCLPE